MESNQLKTLKIDWLGHCPTCEREQHTVSTSEGNKDYLYEDDTVKCWCGQTGVIETDGQGHAWCNWDEKAVSEWDKFNIYYRQKYPEYWGLLPKANHQACSHHEELFNSWVTAKSQAVPEGFVLVPRVITDEWMAAYIDPAVNDYCNDFKDLPFHVKESELPQVKEDHRKPIRHAHKQLMRVIEAKEQSHD